VFFKSAFLDMHKHLVWKRNSTQVSKVDRLRRSYFLGDQGTQVHSTVEKKRESIHRNRYFAYQLLDHDTQQIEADDGEEEAEYGDYVVQKRKKALKRGGLFGGMQSNANQQLSTGRTKQTARKSTGAQASSFGGFGAVSEECEASEDDRDSYSDGDEEYRCQPKKPMEAKQSLLHLVSTEIVLNTRLHGGLTCLHTTFNSWNALLPHRTISIVLDFLGVSDKWQKFFVCYLQAPLKFIDDPSSEPRLRRRGMPGSHALSDTLGEAVLFCLDFAVNQATDGPDLHRLGDDVWFWNKDYNTCANAWASIVKFVEVTGVKVSFPAKSTMMIQLTVIPARREEDRQCSRLARRRC
jgi:hypothetical protein